MKTRRETKKNGSEIDQEIQSYRILYPLIKHPLQNMRTDLKRQYVEAIRQYSVRFCPEDQAVKIRLERFEKDFIQNSCQKTEDNKQGRVEFLSVHFMPYNRMTYRYLFLFDCIFILAPTDKLLAYCICEEIDQRLTRKHCERYIKKQDRNYRKKLKSMREFVDCMYFESDVPQKKILRHR